MLSRTLPGAALESLAVEGEDSQGGKTALDYQLRAQLGRAEGAELRTPATLLPVHLGRRDAELAERKKPLLLQSLERFTVRAAIALPNGLHLRSPPAPTELKTRFGSYRWSAKEEAGRLLIEEALLLPPQRIAPADYPAFVAFTREVDQTQDRELVIARCVRAARGQGAPAVAGWMAWRGSRRPRVPRARGAGRARGSKAWSAGRIAATLAGRKPLPPR